MKSQAKGVNDLGLRELSRRCGWSFVGVDSSCFEL